MIIYVNIFVKIPPYPCFVYFFRGKYENMKRKKLEKIENSPPLKVLYESLPHRK